MLKTQRWSPDSCQCVMLETWEDTVDAAARTHTFQQMEVICPAHTSLAGEPAYQTVRAENRRKNLVAVAAKSVRTQFVDSDYTWSFDAQRRLIATIQTFTIPQKNALQAAVDLQFGPGTVLVQ